MISVSSLLWVIPMSLYLADLVVGLVHMTGDFFQLPQFIHHHEAPRWMTTKGYVHHTFRSYLLSLIVVGIFRFHHPLWITTTLLSIHGNEIHAWLHVKHQETVPNWIQWLQKNHLILDSASHLGHHRNQYDRQFCTLTGWANPLLNCLSIPLYSRCASFRESLLQSPTYLSTVQSFRA
jgi:hypothetical protein